MWKPGDRVSNSTPPQLLIVLEVRPGEVLVRSEESGLEGWAIAAGLEDYDEAARRYAAVQEATTLRLYVTGAGFRYDTPEGLNAARMWLAETLKLAGAEYGTIFAPYEHKPKFAWWELETASSHVSFLLGDPKADVPGVFVSSNDYVHTPRLEPNLRMPEALKRCVSCVAAAQARELATTVADPTLKSYHATTAKMGGA